MKAVVFHGVGDVRLDEVAEPKIEAPTDAIVRLTASAICGTDLHMIRGTLPGMKPGTVLGHEGVGIVEEIGKDVRNLKPGDRVVIPSTIACGACSYCRSGYYAQCDEANPGGSQAGTAFFGGPEAAGSFHGLQAEYARIPYANVGLVKLPDAVTDDQAILISDIFPTGYFGADIAEVDDGDTVCVWGCGPVGLFAIRSAQLMNAARVIAVDCLPDRLAMAAALGAEVVNFAEEDPVEQIMALTNGIGVDRAIDAVGVDAMKPDGGPAAGEIDEQRHEGESKAAAPERHPTGDLWVPGDAPALALDWAIKGLAKAGTLGIIGVYPPQLRSFPIGMAMNRNLTVKMGNCNHRRYVPRLVDWVKGGLVDPEGVLSHREPLTDVIEAYEAFDSRRPGWIKVALSLPKAA